MTGGVLLGFITGLTYGLLAVGIVLIYKANRFINLAHAQLGALSALVLGRLVLENGWSWWVAFPTVVALGAGVGLVVERVVVRPMVRRRRGGASLLLVSIGVAQLLLALTYVQGLGPSATSLYRNGYPLPFEAHVDTGSLVLGGQHLTILILVPLIVAALAVFLQRSAWGRALRATASNPDAARLCGIHVTRVNAIAWAMAGGLSAVTAVLQAPSQGSFNASALGPGLLLRSLGAAALGGFTSIPWALAGGLLIGEAEHITLAQGHASGPAELVVLITVVVILFARGKVLRKAVELRGDAELPAARLVVPPSVAQRAVVRHSGLLLSAFCTILAFLLPFLPYFSTEAHRFQLNIVMVMAIVGMALTMLLGWSGQVSLGHFAVLGLGAYLAARLEPHGFSLVAILVTAGLVGAATMALVGLPALRLQGLSLALTSLGFALAAPAWLFHQSWLGREGQSATTIHPAGLISVGRLDTQLKVYLAALVLLLLVLAAGLRLRRSLPGRLMVAVRDNERAVASIGIMPESVKLQILAVSGAIACMAGVLWGTAWRTVSVDLVQPESSLLLLAIPVIGGLGSLGGAVAAAILVYLPSFFLAPLLTDVFGSFARQIGFQLFVGGLGLAVMPLVYPSGIAGIARQAWQRFLTRMARSVAAGPVGDGEPLAVCDVHLSFGGLRVLDGVDIHVGPGEVVGLIGPNGAGKSTLLNVISGDLRPDAGHVMLFGRDVTQLPPELHAHFGLGRNHQDATLFPGLTVREALEVSLARTTRVGVLSAMVAAPWVKHAERKARRRVDEVVDRLGLAPWADTPICELSTGTRRICELAAQLAGRPRLLLLDEPTAGVAQREAEAFGPLLRLIREELDCSVLIIEHDMPLLMGLCDRVYALAGGRVIAVGTPDEVRADPDVIATYLGTTETAVARSGRVGASS